jgi:hypothetical protein
MPQCQLELWRQRAAEMTGRKLHIRFKKYFRLRHPATAAARTSFSSACFSLLTLNDLLQNYVFRRPVYSRDWGLLRAILTAFDLIPGKDVAGK